MNRIKLSERKSKVLQVVIHHYIKTARPVGSKIIVRDYGFNLSSATIRNVLSELEEGGYLTHPHTSAGRIPTDRGYRFYVDALEKAQCLTIEEMEIINKEYIQKRDEQDEILRRTSYMLSMISSHAGFVMMPKLDRSILKHIELILLEGNRLLVILVTEKGIVNHKVVNPGGNISGVYIRRLSEILNEKLAGRSMDTVKKEVVSIIEKEFNSYYSDTKILKRFFQKAMDFNKREVYFESSRKQLTENNYENYSRIREIFEKLEEKKRFADVLQSAAKAGGVKVVIGEESFDPGMKECSMVTSTYRTDDKTVGVLGVIGPRRMEYSRMISLVDYMSRFINRLLKRNK